MVIMDQFGGEKKVKFNIQKFEELLLSISTEDMTRQQQKLNEAFENWIKQIAQQIKPHSQTDDVLVVGIKFSSLI